MARPDPVVSFHGACRRLRAVLDDHAQDWLAEFVSSQRDPYIDRVYEVACFLDIAARLSERHSIRAVPARSGPVAGKFALPKKPAYKSSFAYFRLTYAGRTFDLCHGTSCKPKGQPKEAPDISLQRVDSDTAPSEPGQVLAVWDAKYVESESAKESAMSLLWYCHVLDVPRPTALDDLGAICGDGMGVSAVLTTRQRQYVDMPIRLKHGFSISFEHVPDGTCWRLEPSRAEHLSNAPTSTSAAVKS